MSRWDLYFHIVWATKNRQPFLTEEREAAVYKIIVALTQAEGQEVLELNGTKDHVHLLLKSGPKFDLSELMKKIKGASSSMLNDMTYHAHHFRWQDGYFAATITPAHLPKVRTYIQNQKEHHQTGNLHRYWEECGDE